MALTKSSVLHYWSARYGINPRVGGRPAFTRNSAGLFVSQEGEADTAIVNTPRSDWATLNLPNAQTERRKAMTLERATSNLVVSSESFAASASWVAVGTPTLGTPDTSCGISLDLMGDDAAGAFEGYTQTVAFTGDGSKGFSFHIKQGSSASSVIRLRAVGVADRVMCVVTWNAGVPTISGVSAGTLLGVDPLEGGAYRVRFMGSSSLLAAQTNSFEVYPATDAAFTVANVGTIYVGGLQAENSPNPTAYVKTTTGAASRAADSCSWLFPPTPQAMFIYSRHVESGSIKDAASQGRAWQIGKSDNTDARLMLYANTGFYQVEHRVGGSGVLGIMAVAPVDGDTVELLARIGAGGDVGLYQSINAAAATSSAGSAGLAFAAAWSDARLWMNSVGALGIGSSKFTELKVVKGADVVGVTADDRMAELRNFELGPNGDVL